MPPLPVLVDIGRSLEACARQDAEGAVKTREDLERYRRIIAATQPEVIVECGTWRGGSALWFANLGLDVVTIDVAPGMPVSHDRVTQLVGFSKDPAIVAAVADKVRGRRVMVTLDSDHSAANVAAEITAYGPFVTPGCYLVVEDGVVRWMAQHPWQGSPLDAIESMLADNDSWRRDVETESAFPVSLHPAGWWIKVGDASID